MGCHFLLQGIFPTQRSNPGLLLCRWTLYHQSHQGNPIGKWEDSKMVFASASFLVVEQAPQSGCCQHLSPRGVLVAPWLSRRFSKVVWPRLISNYCLCAGLWAWRILHVPFKGEFLFPAALHPSCTQAPRAIRARCSGDSSAQCRTPGLGCWRGAQTPCSSARTSATVMILPLWVTHPGRGSWLYCISYPSCCSSFFIFLVVENIFC